MHLKEGSLLKGSTYRIKRFIASGGFGCTYEAVHLMLNKRVAIKEFFPKTFCNRDADTLHVTVGTLSQHALVKKLKFKFVNEAQSIAQLSHPNIVKVTDVFEENGTAYYVMDYIEGKSLGNLVDEKGKLTESEALSYMHQICDALEYVHDQNRLHLDIKPGNIMIDGKGRAILIDFGASKQYDEENGENTSTLIGKTPGFAPIEQMGNDVSHFRPATDIYSLGATLYKCLSGKIPIEPNLRVQGEKLDELPSEVSESTKKAIEAAMELNPKKRPQTIKDFVSILDQSNSGNQESEGTIYDGSAKKAPIANTGKSVNKSASKDISQHSNQITGTSNSSNSEKSSSTDESSKKEKSKSSNIIIGAAAAVIIALLCWIAFGGNNNGTTSQNEEGEGIASLSDSLINSNTKENSPGQAIGPVNNNASDVKPVTLVIVPPTNVKVGEEFKVIYRLSNGHGVDFKTKDINGCLKLSGPMVSETKNGLDYVFTYKAEKEGSYTIPSASIKVDGNSLNSSSLKFSVNLFPNSISENSPTTHTTPYVNETIPQTKGKINGHEYVDLGLPSGLKWATCNIGASSPDDYGNYFAWGEIKTKPSYTEENSVTFNKNNQWLRSNDYIRVDKNLNLLHDAARQNWGSTWRMPTFNEIVELIENTTSEWTTYNGIKGRLVKSKKNDNSIFLPAARWRYGSSIVSQLGNVGAYWTSTPTENNSEAAHYLGFDQDNFDWGWGSRDNARPIRPVSN